MNAKQVNPSLRRARWKQVVPVWDPRMGIPLVPPPLLLDSQSTLDRWQRVFAGRERELNDRMMTAIQHEKQSLSMVSLEPENLVNSHLTRMKSETIDAANILVLEDLILDELDGSFTLPFMPEYRRLKRLVGEVVKTTCRSGLHRWSNFGHFLCEQVGLIPLYDELPEAGGLPLVVNKLAPSTFARLEEGWPGEHRIVRHRFTLFKRIYVSVHRDWQYNKTQTSYFRARFLRDPGVKASRRLYISRQRSRQLLNDEEVCEFLRPRGFERVPDTVLEGLSLREQAALFRSAAIIVSPLGSHLLNALYCAPNAVVLELFKFAFIELTPTALIRPSDQSVNYHFMIDWSPWETALETIIHARIRVNVDKLDQLLEPHL